MVLLLKLYARHLALQYCDMVMFTGFQFTICGKTFPADDVVSIEGSNVCGHCKPTVVQGLREGYVLTSAMHYAGFWIRFVAVIVDGIIISIPYFVFYALIFAAMTSGGAPDPDEIDAAGAVLVMFMQLYAWFGPLAYYTFFWGKYGATPGKMVCGLKIVTADGGRVSYARALGRAAFITFVGGFTCGIVNLVSAIMIAADDEKRGIHDHVCTTRVIWK